MTYSSPCRTVLISRFCCLTAIHSHLASKQNQRSSSSIPARPLLIFANPENLRLVYLDQTYGLDHLIDLAGQYPVGSLQMLAGEEERGKIQ